MFDIPKYDGCGIYAIINVHKMMCYIGSSGNIKRRAEDHRNALKRNRHANKALQSDYNNGARFDFVILEKIVDDVAKDFLIAKEKMYMLSALDNCFSIYNLLPKTESESQREWICTHLLWYFTRKYNTKETLIECFKEKYGVTPAYMKNRSEENRN